MRLVEDALQQNCRDTVFCSHFTVVNYATDTPLSATGHIATVNYGFSKFEYGAAKDGRTHLHGDWIRNNCVDRARVDIFQKMKCVDATPFVCRPLLYAPNVMGWIDPWGLKPCNIKPKTIEALQAAKPSNMINPHMHHIVMEGAFSHWTKENRKLITQARSVLRKHGIDIQGSKNVVWAENAGHSVEYAREVLNRLKKADKGAQAKQKVLKSLEQIGKELELGPLV